MKAELKKCVEKKRMETYEQKELQSDLYKKTRTGMPSLVKAEINTKKDSISNDSD